MAQNGGHFICGSLVTMRNPRTNEIASCAASYRQVLDGSFRSQEDCIADYQQKGYERIFLPGGQR